MTPPQTPSASPTQRFKTIIQGLLRSVGARVSLNRSTGGYPEVGMAQLPSPMARLVSDRFSRAGMLFAKLAERVRLGIARSYPDRAPPKRAQPPDAQPDAPPHSASPSARQTTASGEADAARLPRQAGGVLGLLYWEAVHHASQLRTLLADPEAVALIQSAPGFARILRPLCRMLAVEPPAGLFPPLPPRRPRGTATRAGTPLPPTPIPQDAAEPDFASMPSRDVRQGGAWERPRPAAWERQLEARIARPPRKNA